MMWVCLECGARQADAGACSACHKGDVMDARREDIRELMRDIDIRLGDKREAIVRWAGVGIGCGVIFACWLIPGYWGLRGRLYPGLPFLFDQWALMILLAFGVIKLAGRFKSPKRFPYLDDASLQIRDEVAPTR